MDIFDILNIVIFSIPEGVALTAIACGFIGAKPRRKAILITGALTGALSYFWRSLVSSYVLNVLTYDAVLIGLLGFHKIADPFRRAAGVIMGTCIYITIEFINVKAMQMIFQIDLGTLPGNLFLCFICFMPQLAAAAFVFFIIQKYNLSLFKDPGDGCKKKVKHDEE